MKLEVRELYRQMPGAPMPPIDDEGFYAWGEVEGSDHWAFCHAIVATIDRRIAVTAEKLARMANAATAA